MKQRDIKLMGSCTFKINLGDEAKTITVLKASH